MANLFEDASEKTKDSSLIAKWLVGDVSALLNKDNISIEESKLYSIKSRSELSFIDIKFFVLIILFFLQLISKYNFH